VVVIVQTAEQTGGGVLTGILQTAMCAVEQVIVREHVIVMVYAVEHATLFRDASQVLAESVRAVVTSAVAMIRIHTATALAFLEYARAVM
jgi:hypothetical protein